MTALDLQLFSNGGASVDLSIGVRNIVSVPGFFTDSLTLLFRFWIGL